MPGDKEAPIAEAQHPESGFQTNLLASRLFQVGQVAETHRLC